MMKKFIIQTSLIIFFVMSFMSCSKDDDMVENKIVQIPDAKFKELLMARKPKIDTNKDGEIQFSEAEKITGNLIIYDNNINDLTGLSAFKNIDSLDIFSNNYKTLDLKGFSKLSFAKIGINSKDPSKKNQNLTTINLQTNLELKTLVIGGSPNLTNLQLPNASAKIEHIKIECVYKLKSINLSSFKLLKFVGLEDCFGTENVTFPETIEAIRIHRTKIKKLDLSKTSKLTFLQIVNNPYLTYANIKNTKNKILNTVYFSDCFKLKTICVDDVQYSKNNTSWSVDSILYSATCN